MALIEHCGDGYPSRDTGNFVVKYADTERAFSDYDEAYQFYEDLQEPAYLWDSTGLPELCWYKEEA